MDPPFFCFLWSSTLPPSTACATAYRPADSGVSPRASVSALRTTSVVSQISLDNVPHARVAWGHVPTSAQSVGRRESREAFAVAREVWEDTPEGRGTRAHRALGSRGGRESRDRGAAGHQPAHRAAVAESLHSRRSARAAQGRPTPRAKQGRPPGGDPAGGGGHAAHDAPGGHALDHPHDGPRPGAVPHDGAAHLEATRPAAPSGGDLQAVPRPALRGEAPGCRGPVLGSTRQGPGAVGGREEPDSGPGPNGAAAAVASRHPRPADA